MGVLIVLAAVLGVVILYNLTNINVAERMRELSTIKVLGFYDKEVTLYIYRETILLSIIGIFVGWGFGELYMSILSPSFRQITSCSIPPFQRQLSLFQPS